ncbi:hypothetical protein NR800_00465 [Corallococcus interemptor]|uniref:hypothetical protein n=1 Tax=Corallococcus TaxID=83461 RepID=UPI001CC0A72D|nr:hypothetical protein [Corallococcus sp. AS-1-12]MBZ4329921.1 hypothetical protein [Corallococcus sp. AS-1-12]
MAGTQKQKRTRGNGGHRPEALAEPRELSKGVSDGPAAAKLRPLIDVIDKAVASIPDTKQREEAGRILKRVVGGAIHDVGRLRAVARGEELGATAQSAMAVAKQVKELGFVEFTAGLIDGTFNAIIAATIKQMEAYSKLVADLSKSLSEFQSENVTDAQVTAYLERKYPDGKGSTCVRPDFIFENTPADPATGAPEKTGNAKLKEVARALELETRNLKQPLTLTVGNDVASFTSDQILTIRQALAQTLAVSMIEHLRSMAREGMARIVISEGELLSKLTFKVNSTETDAMQQSKFNQSNYNVGLSVGGSFPWVRASLNMGYSHVSVSTMNESSFDAITMSTEIIGQVKINFRTQTFEPVVVEGPIT